MAELQIHRNDQLSWPDGPQAAGVTRGEAVVGPDAIAIEVHTPPGALSAWHHHGEHQTYGYVVSGRLRLEFGPGGGNVLDAGPGDFFTVPPHTVHREGNPATENQVVVGFRLGSGPTVINVDGPD